MSRTVVVTGGAGFIGSHLTHRLVQLGDSVRVIDNLSTGNRDYLTEVADAVEFFEGDINDPELVRKATRGADVIFHQAALASVPLSIERPLDVHQACATGTLNLLEQARRNRVSRFVYAASSSLYGNTTTDSNREIDLPSPMSPYAVAKLSGEYYCQAYFHTHQMETVGLRYFNVFGPRQDPNSPYSAVIPLFITRLLAGQRPIVYGDGDQSRDFTYVGNIVDANLLAATAPANRVAGRSFNIANGSSTSLNQLLTVLQDLLGTQIQRDYQSPRAGEVRHSRADIRAAQERLDYQPRVDFESGLKLSIDYYRRLVACPAQ